MLQGSVGAVLSIAIPWQVRRQTQAWGQFPNTSISVYFPECTFWMP